jgi:tetratricopeptide (TPR) repeat protein
MQKCIPLERYNEGGKYVQKEDKENLVELIRTLDELVRENFLIADERIYVQTIKILSDSDSQISICFIKSLIIHLSIFVPYKSKTKSPPWIDYLKSNKGLRNFSKEYADSTNDLFKIFGLKTYSEISKLYIYCPHYAYSLAEYDLAKKLIKEPRTDYLAERIHLQTQGEITVDFLERIASIEMNDANTVAMNSYLMLKLFKNKDLRYEKIQRRIERYVERLREYSSENKTKIHIQILNSLNFTYLHSNINKVYMVFDLIETILEENLELKNLYMGNLFYQKSTHEEIKSQPEAQVFYLLKSNEFETLFHTVLYKLAMSYHDKDEFEKAKIYYELALEVSPLNINLINDYGVCLNQMKSRETKALFKITNNLKIKIK